MNIVRIILSIVIGCAFGSIVGYLIFVFGRMLELERQKVKYLREISFYLTGLAFSFDDYTRATSRLIDKLTDQIGGDTDV